MKEKLNQCLSLLKEEEKTNNEFNCDRLEQIFLLRKAFMTNLSKTVPKAQPKEINPASKDGQKYLRDLALHGVEEMFEALQHLKNWKSHRQTDVGGTFNKEEFLEEMVDAFNYFFSLMIHLNIDSDEFFKAYLNKDIIINDRLKNGY